MHALALAMFWLCAFFIAYVYLLYPLLLILAGYLCRRPPPPPLPDAELPTVHVLIPAYNEEKIIARKIEGTLNLDYPKERLLCTVISDRSTDATDSIVQRYTNRGIRFLRNEVNKGKIQTLSEIGSQSQADVLLITDANAIFDRDALRKLVAHFADPCVGLVNGNRIMERTATMAGEGEGAYWVYETALKRAESDVFSNAFITGAMTAIRRPLFVPLPGYLEFDHVLPLHVVNQGYRVVFAADALFYEATAVSSRAEWRVRVRNAVRGFTMVLAAGRYISFRRHPWFVLHVYSRKVLRWSVAIPVIGLLVSNAALLRTPVFQVAGALQALFFAAALAGLFLDRLGLRQRWLALPFYFCLVNAASLVGFFQAIRGRRLAVWTTGR
jgi:cellulose synthase/poly-beta-1,6-N-acetylglucosamine synthase-like glycosyltransferase